MKKKETVCQQQTHSNRMSKESSLNKEHGKRRNLRTSEEQGKQKYR